MIDTRFVNIVSFFCCGLVVGRIQYVHSRSSIPKVPMHSLMQTPNKNLTASLSLIVSIFDRFLRHSG